MSIVKRYNPLKDLDELDVLIDNVNTSPHIIISDMPESLPQGKSSFLIETGPYMKDGIDLLVDFVDGEGNSIYTEPVADYLEGTSRRISVEVYSDTAPGPANIIVVGEVDEVPTGPGLFADTEPVPEEFQGSYNVRLTREVIINPVAINIQPIRFYTQPKISISERRLGTLIRTDSSASISSSIFTVEGTPADGFGFVPFSTEEPKQGALAETSTKIVQSKNKTGKFSRMRKSFKNKKGKRRFSLFKRAGHIAKRSSPEEFPYSYKVPGSDHNFTTKQIDGEIILKSIDTAKYNEEQFQELKLTYPPTISSANTSSIEDVVNSKTALVSKPYTQTNSDGEEITLPFFGTAETVFMPEPTSSYSVSNIISYAEVKLSEMRTFSGDVFKAKVYVRPEGSFDDFKVLAEVPIEASELMVDLNSVGRGERSGYFENQADINTYWEKFGNTNGLTASSTEVMNYSNVTVLDAVNLSGSLATFENHLRFELKDAYKFNMTAGLDYTLSFVAYGKKGTSGRALMIPYMSGSSMYQQPVPLIDDVTEKIVVETSAYGKRLGELEILSNNDNEVDFKVVTHEFTADKDGDAIVQFRVVDGSWFLSDISVAPSTDTGFSPSYFSFDKEMPAELQHKRPETFEFMVEFYDPNNNIADSIAFNSGSLFTGANLVITGDDNTMAGDLFIGGDTTASGMHFGGVDSKLPETGTDGADGSGFMRSVGYLGFTSASNAGLGGTYGFMIYSGSVLPDSGDNYDGVGLELIGQSGSLRFRTKPSVFDVQADSFFVGKTTTQFISGSGGAIEISSSGVHITPEGNVTASAILLGDKGGGQYLQFDAGQLTVQGNLSVDNIQTPATINGSPSTLSNASASITAAGFAKFVSASIGGFDVDSVSISDTSNNLVMSASGQITGSNVLFTGGKIASFTLSNDAFTAGNTFFISSSVTTDDGYFISSSKFNVRAGGDVTGSNVRFDGGTIAGWSIGGSTLTGGNLILNKAGTVKSADYQSDVAGFIISAEDNGYAEFENIRVRGTMATTTFEKESVNAVGGQLFVANSTTISGSVTASATDTTMSIANASGFSYGEVLIAKKVTATGFTTEYMQVNSASLDGDVGNGDLYGRIYVTRSIASSFDAGTDSGSVGDTGAAATFYHPGQVLASTGKIGTGYIRLNANPNNQATPYIDIVERTGSKPYDVELKTRVGDLSGVAGTRNVPEGFTGFGIMSEVAFLSGSNIKLETPSFILGDKNSNFVSGSGGNIEISSSNFHLTVDGNVTMSGDITAGAGKIGGFTITDTKVAGASNRVILTTDAATDMAGEGISGVYGGFTHFILGHGSTSGRAWYGDSDQFFSGKGSGTSTITDKVILLDAGSSSISIGNYADSLSLTSGSGIFLSGSGEALIGDADGERISFDGSNLIMSSSDFYLGSSAQYISGSNGNIEISSSNFHLTVDGDVIGNRMTLSDYAQADYFNFKNVTIDCSDATETGQYFVKYQYGVDGEFNPVYYYALIVNGSRGGLSGAFIRLNSAASLAYPIGMIIAPGFEHGHQLYIEGAADYAYFAEDKKISSADLETAATNASLNTNVLSLDFSSTGGGGTSHSFTYGKYHLGSDSDDTIGGSSNNVAGDSFYSYDLTISDPNVVTNHDGGAYTNLGRIGLGDRYHFVKSLFDWRVMSVSAYSFAPSFAKGIAVAGNSGGVTIGDTALQNSTYKLNVSNGAAYVRDHIVTGGGIHVGGTSDPGDDNLLVDGDVEVTGDFTAKQRQLLHFGYDAAVSATGGTTTITGKGPDGASNGKGYRMNRAGSVVGLSGQLDIAAIGGGNTWTLQVYKNGSSLFTSNTTTNSGTGDNGGNFTYATGTYTFAAGDQITVKLNVTESSTVSPHTVANIMMFVEIETL